MPALAVTYFDAPGRAESIRVALHLGGLSYEDIRLKYPQFAEAKARGDFPLGSVPVLTVDGVPVPQTAAILRYVARIGDRSLYPEDPRAALVVDSALDCVNDTLSNALTPSLFERDPAKKLELRAAFAAGPMARVFKHLEGLIEDSGGPFVSGAALSIADIVIALQVLQILSGNLDGLSAAHLEPYPRLGGLAEAFLADPRVQDYRASKVG